MTRRMSLPRGVHAFSWTPPARGDYTVRIAAKGPSGPVGRFAEDVGVVLPKPAKRKKRAQPPSTPGTAPLRKASTKRR
jgi:hypothetical protein